MPIHDTILTTIGNTPLVRIPNLIPDFTGEIFAKIESFNPSASIKVRVAAQMIQDAEEKGLLDRDSHIVEPTSGNTGIGLAMVAAVKGYRISLVMPESASLERRKILRAYGADVILTPTESGMKGAISRAQSMAAEDPHVFIPNQFENPANPLAHERTTAQEIWEDTAGKLDIFIAAVGTGGTITGVGRKLKQLDPRIKVVAIEPEPSQVLSGQAPRPHKIQGMGAGFIPPILDLGLIDHIVAVSEARAYHFTRELAQKAGIFAGISSGAAIAGIEAYLKQAPPPANAAPLRIVTIFPDTGERYLSTDLW